MTRSWSLMILILAVACGDKETEEPLVLADEFNANRLNGTWQLIGNAIEIPREEYEGFKIRFDKTERAGGTYETTYVPFFSDSVLSDVGTWEIGRITPFPMTVNDTLNINYTFEGKDELRLSFYACPWCRTPISWIMYLERLPE